MEGGGGVSPAHLHHKQPQTASRPRLHVPPPAPPPPPSPYPTLHPPECSGTSRRRRSGVCGPSGSMGDGGPAPPELGALRAHVAGTSAGDGPRGLGGSGPWAPAAWRTALEALFLGAAPGAGREADDLVFLVRGVGEGGAAAGAPPEGWEVLWEVLVRRRGPAALLDLGQGVDWTRSFYLNVVLQARYQLTVALCQGADLERHRAGLAGPATPLMKVTRRVYASPSRVSVDPAAASGRAEAPPQPAYPDVFFFVPDFTDAFGDVVAARPSDQCLCVLLSCTGCGALDPGVAGGGAAQEGSGRRCVSSRVSSLRSGSAVPWTSGRGAEGGSSGVCWEGRAGRPPLTWCACRAPTTRAMPRSP